MPEPAPAIWVCFAVRQEAAPFRKRLRHRCDPLVMISGMGPRNAERMIIKALSRGAPRAVFTCGFAGGLDPELRIGDIVFDEDPGAGFGESLRGLGARPAGFYAAGRVAITVAEKADLRRTTGADAVEMESFVIREHCRRGGIPSVTVRAISDTADEDLPLDFNRVATADQQLSWLKFGFAVLKRPQAIPGLLRLQRQTTLAAERLSDVLVRLLGLP